MKTSLKSVISIFILGTLYCVFSGVSALCTLTPDNYQCNEDEVCTLSTGCACYGSTIAFNGLCNGASISVDNSVVSSTAISGSLMTFKFTVTSYTGDKYFMLHLPLTIDYGIKYLNSSIIPDNASNLSLGTENNPRYTVHAGETKTFVVTGKVVAQYRAILPMLATGNVYKDLLFQQLSVQALSSLIDPAPYITIIKTMTGAAPRFSGDALTYEVTLQNIGSLGVIDLSFLERFPLSYLYAPVVSFDGTIQNYSSFIAPNLYVYSGAYLVVNPGQIINILISSSLNNTYTPTSFLNAAAFTTGGSLTPSVQDTAVATGFIQPYVDIIASTITTGSTAPQMSGDAFAFTFNYGQLGNITATGMTMTLTITGTNILGTAYALSDLTMSTTGSITVTGTLNANYTAGTQVCANAYFASPTETASTGNNSITSCYTVAPIADILITKTLWTGTISSQNVIFNNRDTVQSGSRLIYAIVVTNTGTKTATGITVTDILPSQTNVYAVSTGGQIIGNTVQRTINLAPGQTQNLGITVVLNTYAISGILITNTGTVSFTGRDANPANNTYTLTIQLPGLGDLYITKTLLPFSGFAANTPVTYVLDYGNSGGRTVSGVYILDDFPSQLHLVGTQTGRIIGTLAPGQTGRITLVATMPSLMTGGTTFTNTALIGASSTGLALTGTSGVPGFGFQNLPFGIAETTMTNNISTVTGTIPVVDGVYLDLIANNLTRPQLDNPPYGTNQNTMIQAVSGDVVRFTLYYGANGNVPVNSATLSLGGLAGITSIQNSNVTLGNLTPGASGTIIMTGIVGPKNFITFSPVATLMYNTNQSKTDMLIINEPLVCGDGLVTQTEECDTNGPVGNIAPGQECENQQGACVLVTKFIINNACISFDYNNPVTGYGTGASCSSVAMPLTQASCSSLSVNGTAVTCNAVNATASTRIAINCGNGTILSGFGTSLAGTCTNGGTTATCLVGGETTAVPACVKPLNAAACIVNTLDGDMIVLDENGDGTMPVVCEANDGSQLINANVDCGIDGHYSNGVCTYTDINNTPTQRTITCSVAGGVSCDKDLIADQGFLADCGDGDREGYEQCDDGNNVSGDGCSSRCEREDDYDAPACFNVNNGNISVQEGEKMPFRWNLEIKKNTTVTPSANHQCDPGDIKRDTMKCTFKIYNGENKQSDGDAAETFVEDCYNPDGWNVYTNLFNYFKTNSAFGSENNAFGRFVFAISSALTDKVYGEYKLSLDQVDYEYCGDDEQRHDGNPVGRICEVNFAVTRPYLAQKSAFGLTPKSTDINLDGYEDINGNDIVRNTDLDKIMTVGANEYDGGQEIKTKMSSFITKYNNLAIKIDKSKLSNLAGLENVTTIKKVPNQNIYIFIGAGDITLNGAMTTPFTFITKGLNLKIKGDLTTNGMFLVQGGKIGFEEPDGALRCSKTQEVKGIFVTDKGFISDQLANTISSRPRCNFGGLYVKGVLIGDGIDNLVKARRSQLNSRFYLTSSNENSQKAQRRNKIFNGAAVLIEYSPSLWNALPPGANEFTKALEVYKK